MPRFRPPLRPLVLLLLLSLTSTARSEDLVEFLSGAKVRGEIKAIRKEAKEFDIAVDFGGRTIVRTYPYDKIHAVTMRGKRFVLNEPSTTTETTDGKPATRSPGEVVRLIESIGSTPPDWYAETPLEYPDTLDLSWPLKPPTKGWNNQLNVGQYLWDIINPNPGRWQSGIKLLHHLLEQHQSNPTLMQRDMQTLGTKYFELFQDYARAAYWFRKANVQKGTLHGVLLAECYWRLGSRKMAFDQLQSKSIHPQTIKLLGDMGDTDRALQYAELYANAGQPHQAYLLAGDAARLAKQYNKAITYYEKVLNAGDARNEDYQQRFAARARESIEAIRLFEQLDVSALADGSYRGTSTGYNGEMEVEVEVNDGRIESVDVVRHEEKQFYSAINDTTSQIVRRQSVNGIDATSRATITSQAIVNATARALAK